MKSFRLPIWHWLILAGLLLGVCGAAAGQSVDAYFGLNALTASVPTGNAPLGGGVFPEVGGDVIFFHGIGVGADVSWRGSQNNFNGTYYRPLYYDFNAVWQPWGFTAITPFHMTPVLEAGIGAQSLRVYQGYYNCSFFGGCSDYQSSNHFVGHFAVMVKFYITHRIFIAPQAQLFWIRHDTEFGASTSHLYGFVLGYTLSANPL